MIKGFPKAMKIIFLVIAAIIVAEIAFLAVKGTQKGAAVSTVEALSVRGTQLYAGDKPVSFKGVSFGWNILWPRFYNKGAVETLHNEWGAKLVRAAIGVDDLMDDHTGLRGTKTLYKGFISDPEAGYGNLYAVVDAAIACGAYVIVDWHSHVMHTEEALEFFKTVSAKYAGVPNVIYELYNEPVDDSWEQLKAYSETMIAAIRAHSPAALILVGCPHWDQDINIPAADPIVGVDNLMYTVHFYAATHKDDLRARTEAAIEAGLPVFISECAAMECTGDGPLDLESWAEWNRLAEKHGLSMVSWSFSDKAESCSMMSPEASSEGPWTDEVTKEWGMLTKSWLGE